jgi:hypothetical protein
MPQLSGNEPILGLNSGTGMWGMRGCGMLVEWAPETESFLLSMSLSLDRNPLPWVEFSPSSGETHC